MMKDEEPLRYEMRMNPGFAQKYPRDTVIGVPIRERIDEDVMITGIVVEWIDEPDGGVRLVIEQRDTEADKADDENRGEA
jgi:hypothetical protein